MPNQTPSKPQEQRRADQKSDGQWEHHEGQRNSGQQEHRQEQRDRDPAAAPQHPRPSK
jgi:hypothetical protein